MTLTQSFHSNFSLFFACCGLIWPDLFIYSTSSGFLISFAQVIDVNYYPVEEARNSNMRHRPIGIGVQGFADAALLLRLPFESEGARELNRDIFETLYYGAVEASRRSEMKQ